MGHVQVTTSLIVTSWMHFHKAKGEEPLPKNLYLPLFQNTTCSSDLRAYYSSQDFTHPLPKKMKKKKKEKDFTHPLRKAPFLRNHFLFFKDFSNHTLIYLFSTH